MNGNRTRNQAAPSKEDWGRMLQRKASEIGTFLTPQQIDQFSVFAGELVKWSGRINITAIVDPEEVVVKHFLDSLAAVSHLKSGDRVLDIGTGAGFPGLPLKLVNPSVRMTLIDGSRKKISFVTHQIRTLGLGGIDALQIRSEQLCRDPLHRHAYDVVLCRALSSLAAFVEQALKFTKPRGRILAWKGARAEVEISELQAAVGAGRLKIEKRPYKLPGLAEGRCIVVVWPTTEAQSAVISDR